MDIEGNSIVETVAEKLPAASKPALDQSTTPETPINPTELQAEVASSSSLTTTTTTTTATATATAPPQAETKAKAPPANRKRKRGNPRVNKGLRYFSIKVCEKLSQTGVTSYNDIANLLVEESKQAEPATGADGKTTMQVYDEKNIRRRIYDALNVLMAMDIIAKDGKEIRWRGINLAPINDCSHLVKKRTEIMDRIEQKLNFLQEMTYQFLGTRKLLLRNRDIQQESLEQEEEQPVERVHVPFVVVSTSPTTDVECEMTEDRTTTFFDFADSFTLTDENVLIKDIGVNEAKSLKPEEVPQELKQFLPDVFPDDIPEELQVPSRVPWGAEGKLSLAGKILSQEFKADYGEKSPPLAQPLPKLIKTNPAGGVASSPGAPSLVPTVSSITPTPSTKSKSSSSSSSSSSAAAAQETELLPLPVLAAHPPFSNSISPSLSSQTETSKLIPNAVAMATLLTTQSSSSASSLPQPVSKPRTLSFQET